MCGINGVYFFGETEPGAVEEMLQRMLRATAHRGPDAAATLITAKHGIGVNRLSVIGDPTAAGIYTHGDFLSATFNGVIVNHPDLRRRLSLVPAANPPDGEVILPLFQQRDTDFVRDLHGMFAVCIYDKVRHRLVLARDRLGVKPLYYCVTGGAVYVSSEIKGIAAGMDEKLSPDRSALGHVLRFRFHPGETTVFSKVKRVRPGEIVVFDGPRPKRRYYWSIPGVSDPPREDEKTLSEEVGELVNRVTGDHLLSDVEGGFLASGGLDSSLLVMLASARQSSYRTPFSLRFRPVRTPDEHHAISLSGHLSQPVTWVSVTPRSA